MPPETRDEPFINASEVARMLSVTRAWVYRAAKHGDLPCHPLGKGKSPKRFKKSEVLAWLENQRDDREEQA